MKTCTTQLILQTVSGKNEFVESRNINLIL